MSSHSLVACTLAAVLCVATDAQTGPATAALNPLHLALPPQIQAVTGHEVSIYFDNIVLAMNTSDYAFRVICAKGTQQDERWTFVPTPGDVGLHDLTIEMRDIRNALIGSATTKLRVVAADAGAGKPVTCLIVGDSLTHASVYPEEFLNLCKAPGNPTLTLIGTHHLDGTSPGNRHEGYGGWTAERFAAFYKPNATKPGDSSPFIYLVDGKPKLDFRRYVAENNGGKGPDVITILLGCNDTFMSDDGTIEGAIDTMFANLDKLIREFHSVRPDTKIGLFLLPPPAATQDAFGANYGCLQTRWQYRRNQHRVVERMTATYGGREREFIYLIPDNVNLDTVHNYPTSIVPANSRSSVSISRQGNGCHPSEEGYKQIADSLYFWLKSVV